MKAAALLGLAVAGWSVTAQADDVGMRWSGLYVGLNAGAAWGRSSYATDPGCRPPAADAVFCNTGGPSDQNGEAVGASGGGKFSPAGFTGGVQAGYAWQAGALVYGGEADFGAFNLRKSATASGTFPFPFLGTAYTVTNSISTDWLATLRARLGYAVAPQLLVYATGGAAFAQVKMSGSYADNAIDATFPGGTGSGSASETRVGWTIGGGAQWALNGNWSVRAEYLYADLGSVSVDVPLTNTPDFTQTMRVTGDLAAHLARFGVDYRF